MRTTLVFLAAGFGTRFGGGVKQLAPVGPNGEVLMDYACYDGLRAGFDRMVFIIRRDIEQEFRRSVGGRIEQKCDVEYVFQEIDDLPDGFRVPDGRVKPWGTAQAVLCCRRKIDGPFCVLNADDYYGPDAFVQMHAYLRKLRAGEPMDCCMAAYVLDNTLSESGPVTRGLCRSDGQGGLLSIEECRGIERVRGEVCARTSAGMRPLDRNMAASMNMWGFPPEFMDYLEEKFPAFLASLGNDALDAEFLLPEAVGAMIDEGRGSVRMLPTGERWFGMTYAADKALTRARIGELVEAGVYPQRL